MVRVEVWEPGKDMATVGMSLPKKALDFMHVLGLKSEVALDSGYKINVNGSGEDPAASRGSGSISEREADLRLDRGEGAQADSTCGRRPLTRRVRRTSRGLPRIAGAAPICTVGTWGDYTPHMLADLAKQPLGTAGKSRSAISTKAHQPEDQLYDSQTSPSCGACCVPVTSAWISDPSRAFSATCCAWSRRETLRLRAEPDQFAKLSAQFRGMNLTRTRSGSARRGRVPHMVEHPALSGLRARERDLSREHDAR